MLKRLLPVLLLFCGTPTHAITSSTPISQTQVDQGLISHHVVVQATGGVAHRLHYKSHNEHNVSISNCTGLLLTSNFVLVPARCVSDMATPGEQKLHPSMITVQHSCGLHTPWSTEGKSTCKPTSVDAVFIHPCFRTRVPTTTTTATDSLNDGSTMLYDLGDHDVAVLRLSSSVPSIGALQRYAVLDDGNQNNNIQKEKKSHLLFRGHGSMDQKGTISASLRTATVTVAPNERCINKFLQQQHEVTTSATATITSKYTTHVE